MSTTPLLNAFVRDENGKVVPVRNALIRVDGKGIAILGDSGAAAWGTISGTLASQVDLAAALNGKSDTTHHHDSDYAEISHTHPAVDISDSTALGRSLVKSADQGAAREALGLGDAATLDVGTTAGTVAAGDHTHSAAPGGSVAWGDITGKPTYLYHMEVPWHSDNTANCTLTNQANSEQALQNQQTRARKKLDLSNMTQARLIAHVVTNSASANSPRLYLTYATTYAGARNGLASGANPTVSLASTGPVDTGWFDIAAGAKVDNIFIEVTQNGGDGVADPALGYVHVLFRG